MAPLCSLRDVTVTRGGRPVLKHLDFSLEPSEVVGVSGPNGSGKTTLIRVLATLVGIDAGAATILGAEPGTADMYRVRPLIGMLGHHPALIPQLSVAENLEHLCRLAGITTERASRALEVVGLADAAHYRVESVSHGMARRTEVAGLLLRRPRLLLLDEATHGLDSSASVLIAALIERTLDGGGSTVVVSHDARTQAPAGRWLRLDSGRLVAAQ